MGAHMALHKQHALFGINAGGQQHGRSLPGLTAQGRGILPHGYGVQIRHHIQAIKFLLQSAPVAHCAHIVAQGKGTGGLDAGQDALLALHFFTHCFCLISFGAPQSARD